jgi:hypothetical protein
MEETRLLLQVATVYQLPTHNCNILDGTCRSEE